MRKYNQGGCQLISPFTPVIELDDKHCSIAFFKGKRAKGLNISLKYLPSGLKMVTKLTLFNTARLFLQFLHGSGFIIFL